MAMDPRLKPLEDASAKSIVDTNYDPHFSGVRDRAYHESVLFLARFDALMRYYEKRRVDALAAYAEDRGWVASTKGIDAFAALAAYYEDHGWNMAAKHPLDGEHTQPWEREEGRRIPVMAEPIPMILFCPLCGLQHVDAEEQHKSNCNKVIDHDGVSMSAAAYGETVYKCDCGRWTNPPHRSHKCAGCAWIWRPADVPTTGVTKIATVGEHDSSPIILSHAMVQPADHPRWRHKARGTLYTEIGRGEL